MEGLLPKNFPLQIKCYMAILKNKLKLILMLERQFINSMLSIKCYTILYQFRVYKN